MVKSTQLNAIQPLNTKKFEAYIQIYKKWYWKRKLDHKIVYALVTSDYCL